MQRARWLGGSAGNVYAAAARGAGFGALWWGLAGDAWASWVVGAPTVAFAVVLSLWLAPAPGQPWRLGGAFRFAWFFLRQSLRGGCDVARRALHPERPLEPALLFFPWRLPEGTARVLFANVVSLCPGTLSARLGERGLTLHVLDRRQPIADQLFSLEARVADLFGLTNSPGEGEDRG